MILLTLKVERQFRGGQAHPPPLPSLLLPGPGSDETQILRCSAVFRLRTSGTGQALLHSWKRLSNIWRCPHVPWTLTHFCQNTVSRTRTRWVQAWLLLIFWKCGRQMWTSFWCGRMTTQMVAFEASWSGPQQGRLQGKTAENGGMPVYSPGSPGQDGGVKTRN